MKSSYNSLTVIIPAYNEAGSIRSNFLEIRRILNGDSIFPRFTLVDDGSKDATWSELQCLAQEFNDVCCIRLSRNFGKEAAIFAGISESDSDLYLVMDCDLQHPPSLVKEMLHVMENQLVDIVDGLKCERGRENLRYKFLAKSFYRFFGILSGLNLDNSSDFKLFNNTVAQALRSLPESKVFFRGLSDWVGFSRAEVPFVVSERADGGKSRFSTAKLVKFAVDSMLSYTSKPLYITMVFGWIFFVASLFLGVHTLYVYFCGHAVSGFTTVILLQLIIGSLVLISLGIIGLYISRIYDGVKNRPRYIISDRTPK